MTESNKISRRDWFRLKQPRRNQLLGHDETSPQISALQPIEHPPNHDGLDLAKLPPMRESVLTVDQINALFTDIGQCATDIQLMQRRENVSRASAQSAKSTEQLELAKTALLSGNIPRLQIRYRWENSLWIDTLKAQPDGFHLVRILHAGSTS